MTDGSPPPVNPTNPWMKRLGRYNSAMASLMFALAMARTGAGLPGKDRMDDPPGTCVCHRHERCDVHANERRAAAVAKRERRRARNIRNLGRAA